MLCASQVFRNIYKYRLTFGKIKQIVIKINIGNDTKRI